MLISDIERVERKLRIARANFNAFPAPAKDKASIEKWTAERSAMKDGIRKLEVEREDLLSVQLMAAHMPEATC